MSSRAKAPAWARRVLVAAGVYNIAWGAFVVLAPGALFAWFGMELPNYPGLWQCIGMVVGVYGLGYACAAIDPYRHWPIVLVGLLGKVFGSIGFLQAAVTGEFPWTFGWTIVTNDLIWWLPFFLILRGAWRSFVSEGGEVLPLATALHEARTQKGQSLAGLSRDSPLLVVFLRHLGCTFCRETVQDVARSREELEAAGARPVFVHHGDDAAAAELLSRRGMADALRVSDPERRLYRAFALGRGSLSALFGPRVWWRDFVAGVLKGHGVGKLDGDGFQISGAFLLHEGRMLRSHRTRCAADRPDSVRIALRPETGA
jgi:hypothetical protein